MLLLFKDHLYKLDGDGRLAYTASTNDDQLVAAGDSSRVCHGAMLALISFD